MREHNLSLQPALLQTALCHGCHLFWCIYSEHELRFRHTQKVSWVEHTGFSIMTTLCIKLEYEAG